MGSVLLAVVVVVGASMSAYADLRIVWTGEIYESELLLKRNRMAVWPTENAEGEEQEFIFIDCSARELIFARNGRYWQGSVEEFSAEVHRMFGEIAVPEFDEDMPEELKQLMSALFAQRGSPDEVDVRVVRQGDETVNGFAAASYRVETGMNGVWKVFEHLWMSRDVHRQVQAEVGSCALIWFEVYGDLMSAIPFFPKDAAAVFRNAEYRALYEQGFPVKSVVNMEVFGSVMELESHVMEVSRDPLPDELFTVPAGYERVFELADVFGDA